MKIRYTVPSAQNRVSYSGNGSTQVFPVSYVFFDNTDLDVVLITNATGVETTQVLTANYTVSGGGGSNGSITMLIAPPSGTTLVIERDIPFTQEIDLEPNDPFPAEVTEEGFDRVTMLAQQNRLEIQKSPKLPLSYDPDSDPEMRIPVPEAGKLLIGRQDEAGWDNVDPGDLDLDGDPALFDTVASIAELKALVGRPVTVEVQGYYAAGDGGGGTFWWHAGATEDADDALIVEPTSGVAGRYKRLFSGEFNVKWFGAKGDMQRVYGGSIVGGSVSNAVLTCPLYDGWAGFTSADIGKTIMLSEVGLGVANFTTTIVSVTLTTATLATGPVLAFSSANLVGASVSSVAVGLGSKSFTATTGRSWQVNSTLRFHSAGTPSAAMYGRVTAYDSGTGALTATMIARQNSGTYTDWVIEGYSCDFVFGTLDTAALQEAALTATSIGGKLVYPQGGYMVHQPIVYAIDQGRINNLLLGLFADEYDYVRNMRKIEITGEGVAQVVAVAPMTSVFHISFGATADVTSNNPSPYASEIYNMSINGSRFATNGVLSDSMRSFRIDKCNISWATNGVNWSGVYGGNTIEDSNIFGCTKCVVDQNGDNYMHNVKFAPYNATASSTAYGYWTEGGFQGAGNTTIRKCTFQTIFAPYAASTVIYPVWVDGRTASTETFRDITVEDNEFQGPTIAVMFFGYASGPNGYHLDVSRNRMVIRGDGVTNPGTLLTASHLHSFVVSKNKISDPFNLTTAAALILANCTKGSVEGNIVERTNVTPFVQTDCDQISYIANLFRDFGQASTGNQAILSTNSTRTHVAGNMGYQSSGSYAQSLYTEFGTTDYSRVGHNAIFGITNQYVLIGANSSTISSLEGTLPSAKVYTVSTLPAAPGEGAIAAVSDANSTTFLATAVAGGANYVPVRYLNGRWVIG